jgi:hypothetical protein
MKTCSKCNEYSEPQFETCWKCGTSLLPIENDMPSTEHVFDEIDDEPMQKGIFVKDGFCWLYAIITPFITLGLGFVAAMNVDVAQGDMFGGPILLCVGLGLLVGVVSWLIFTVLSVVRQEKWAFVSLFLGALAAIGLVFNL